MTAIKNVVIHIVFLSILLIFKEFAETSLVTQIGTLQGFFLRRFGHFPMLCRVDPDLDPSKT